MNPLSIEVNNSRPVLEFETLASKTDPKRFPFWDRYLTVQGKKVFDLGVTCETCQFVYKRLGDIAAPVAPAVLSKLLQDGLKTIDQSIVETVSALLPSGHYNLGLITLKPKLIAFPKPPQSYVGYGEVKTPFYLAGEEKIDVNGSIKQAVIPLFSVIALNMQTVQVYKQRVQEGNLPTALAVSIAEGKHFMSGNGPEGPDCISLMHFLIDGHHKMYAASQIGKPITVLSFLYDYNGCGLLSTHPHTPPLDEVMLRRYYPS